ncbi:MAG: energy-coupling factor transporter transmembrane component T [Halodesulfurarchaeum sp.]
MTEAPRFDPRAKFALASGFVLASFLAGSIPSQLVLLSLFVGLVVVLREVSLGEWLSALAPIGVLVVLIVGINSIFYASGPAWISVPVGPVRLALTPAGVRRALLIAVRLVVVAGAAAWFALGTETDRFEAALAGIGVPWSFAFLLSLTIGLVPVLRRRFRRIEDAQRSRGLDLSGGPIARTRARIPMLVPFLVATIRYGYELSTALRARGFDEPGPRTSITTVEHGPIDLGLYLLAVGVVAGTIVWL